VKVIGHAGRDEGSQVEIVRLSQCRGDAVKQRLVEEGLQAQRIVVSAKGDAEPLSPSFNGDLRMDRRVTLDSTEWPK